MASNERAVINPQDLIGGDGTLRVALELWNSQYGAVKYNQWMSAFFAMTRDYGMRDTEAPPGETPSDRQKRMKAMYEEILTGLHGPDHKTLAVLRDSECPPARQDLSRVAAQDLPGRANEGN